MRQLIWAGGVQVFQIAFRVVYNFCFLQNCLETTVNVSEGEQYSHACNKSAILEAVMREQ
jgi:hypothetical protein